MSKIKTDVLVIGAGPSGTVAASIIKKAGYDVTIVEKTQFPRFVIGESLLPRCMEALEEAGFLDAVKAQNFQEKSGAKFVKDGMICDYFFADQFTKGWTWTWQVQRAVFDKALADCCVQMGIPLHYETTVTDIRFSGSDSVTTVVDKHGQASTIEARFIVDGSGYGRVIPKLFNLERPSSLPVRKALLCHMRDNRRQEAHEPDRITIVTHKPGVWIWIIPFSNGVTSVGFVGDNAFFDQYKGTDGEIYDQLIEAEPYIKDRFRGAEKIFDVRRLEGWSATTEKFYGDGFVLTGNVTEFLDPVFSSGVTLATVSSQLAAHLVIRKLQGEQIDWNKEYMEVMMQGVNTFRTYVNAWYDGTLDKIFFAEKQQPDIKSMICSVLAGYVWDKENPFVNKHAYEVYKLARILDMKKMIEED
ncbi:MAG TPA: NAD(P)/FAD-dependent oxidoreductase [Flavihumibacter sp.]|nr:tryptophan 7-halogenase [Bacteroidota bacterium]HPZ86514.1 NAD(P)/FAD-dependent oxidoreductase [Flavihumibacter sp.]